MRRCLAIFVVFFAVRLAAAQDAADAIIARVNGQPIMLSQLKEAALDQNVPLSAITLNGMQTEPFRRVLTQIVDEELLLQKAEADQLKADETEVAKEVDKMLAALREELGSEANLQQYLEQRHLKLDELKRLLTNREKRQTLMAEVVGRRVRIDTGELAKFEADRRAKGLSNEDLHLAQILVKCSESERQAPGNEFRARALRLAREAGARPARFADMARRESDDLATRARGGDLGWLNPQSLNPALRDAVVNVEVGQVTEPIEMADGYHILKLQGRRGPRDLLFIEKFTAERSRLLDQLRKEASIQLYGLQKAEPEK